MSTFVTLFFFFVQHVEPNLNLCTNLFCAVLIAILFVPCLYSYLLKLLYAYLLLHNINSCASQQKLNIAQSKLLKKSGHFFLFESFIVILMLFNHLCVNNPFPFSCFPSSSFNQTITMFVVAVVIVVVVFVLLSWDKLSSQLECLCLSCLASTSYYSKNLIVPNNTNTEG